LVFGTSCLADAADALRLKMHEAANLIAIYGECDQGVQRTAKVDHLTGPASSAGDENYQTNIGPIVGLYGCISWSDHKWQQCPQAEHRFRRVGLHIFPFHGCYGLDALRVAGGSCITPVPQLLDVRSIYLVVESI